MASDTPPIAPAPGAALSALADLLRSRTLEERASIPRAGGQPPPAEAAVLVPLIAPPAHAATPSELSLWLLKRPSTMRTHAGQMAFPGGRVDPDDADHVAAALREADEEIGLAPAHVHVLGPLDSLVTPTGFRIRPVVGLVPAEFVPRPNPSEVELVISAPLASFLQAPSGEMPYVGLHIESHWVWGATYWIARTLAELARVPLGLRR